MDILDKYIIKMVSFFSMGLGEYFDLFSIYTTLAEKNALLKEICDYIVQNEMFVHYEGSEKFMIFLKSLLFSNLTHLLL